MEDKSQAAQAISDLLHTKAPVCGWHPERIQEPNSGLYPLNCSDGWPGITQTSNSFLQFSVSKTHAWSQLHKEDWQGIKSALEDTHALSRKEDILYN